MNHYEILEVSASASQDVIRAAYKSLMQRYHPDRNPGDLETAQHALRVNLAYAVLSDADKRAAYDIELKQQAAGRLNDTRDRSRDGPMRQAANTRSGQSYSFLWLMIAAVLLGGWLLMSLSGKRPSPESELQTLRQSLQADALTEKQRQDTLRLIDQILGEHPEKFKKQAGDRSKDEAARTIPILVENLSVNLKAPDKSAADPGTPAETPGKSAEDAGHVLVIPILGVRVGTFDPEKAISFIERNKESISQKLAEKLVSAKYEELKKIEGESYLKNLILDSIGESTGTNRRENYPPSANEAPGRYGATDVLLPQSFSVR